MNDIDHRDGWHRSPGMDGSTPFRTEAPRLRQPIHVNDNYGTRSSGGMMFILRPGVFYWTVNRLYVGYAWLSVLHADEAPAWDTRPVPVGTIIETRAGFYQFTGILQEGEPYRRQYAQLQFAYSYRPDDFGDGFLKKPVDQGEIIIHEKYVLAPETYLEAQWLSGALLHKKYPPIRTLERRIRRSPTLDAMRNVAQHDRDKMEHQFSAPADRERLIALYAV